MAMDNSRYLTVLLSKQPMLCRLPFVSSNANLEGLFLSENQIEAISADLLALAKLKSLWLKGNRIERVENLKSCRLLVFLDLSRNRLTGSASEVLLSSYSVPHSIASDTKSAWRC